MHIGSGCNLRSQNAFKIGHRSAEVEDTESKLPITFMTYQNEDENKRKLRLLKLLKFRQLAAVKAQLFERSIPVTGKIYIEHLL